MDWSVVCVLFLGYVVPRLDSFLLPRPFHAQSPLLLSSPSHRRNIVFSSIDSPITESGESANGNEGMGEGFGFASLRLLNISTEVVTRNVIPQRIVGGSDLFCTRELNMAQMEAIGFDMDFTLAQYTVDFDLLAYNGAKEKLVSLFQYPKEVLDFVYSPDVVRRGCLVDKKRGNVIKLDRFKYVRTAVHGLRKLSTEERKATYIQSFIEMQSYSGPNFASIDTPFSLVDACLFCQLVDLTDRLGLNRSYTQLWTDMRKAVDRCHRDGVIKKTVARDPSKYIIHDANLFPMLRQFKEAGFKVFLLTNSLFDYTQVVMNYLFAKLAGDEKNNNWMEVFDVIIVGGNKPAFLTDEGKLPLLRITDTSSGKLENIDSIPRTPAEVETFISRGKCFQGGNAQMLHQLLQISSGDRLLYVGDHVYADVMRSKRVLGWRTCLIVPELTQEIILHKKNRAQRNQLMALRRAQFGLEAKLEKAELSSEGESNEVSIRQMNQELVELKARVRERLETHNLAFHPVWGQLFKAGFQESRFAQQVTRNSFYLYAPVDGPHLLVFFRLKITPACIRREQAI